MKEGRLIGGQDPFNVQPPGRESRLVFAIPTKDKAIVCKLLFDPRGEQSFIPVTYYNHMIGESPETDTRSHPCRKSLGLGESPENDAYWEYTMKLSALRKEGKGEGKEAKVLAKKKDTFYGREKGWLFFVTPGSATIRALKIPKAVINSLFGKDATQYRPEVKSIIKEMNSNGMSPYAVDQDTGWLKIYRTGTGLATEYHVEVAETTIQIEHNGKKIPAKEAFEAAVHKKIKDSDVTLDDFPDPLSFEKDNCFSLEESKAFVESAGKTVPNRLLRNPTSELNFNETTETAQGETEETPESADEDANSTANTEVETSDIGDACENRSDGPSTPELDEIPF